jgi:hypothetical protein
MGRKRRINERRQSKVLFFPVSKPALFGKYLLHKNHFFIINWGKDSGDVINK